jgi:hypothetical protein
MKLAIAHVDFLQGMRSSRSDGALGESALDGAPSQQHPGSALAC